MYALCHLLLPRNVHQVFVVTVAATIRTYNSSMRTDGLSMCVARDVMLFVSNTSQKLYTTVCMSSYAKHSLTDLVVVGRRVGDTHTAYGVPLQQIPGVSGP